MSHTPAVTVAFDATALAGTTVITTATTGAATLSSDAGVFLCPVGFANGYGSATGYTLSALLNADWPAAGTLTDGIDADGFYYIESDTVDFAIDADPVNAVFGFDTAGQALVGGVAPFRQTAINRFQRGIIKLTQGLMITPSGGSSTEMPTSYPRVQSLVTWIRERGAEGDADDLYDGLCLEDALPAGSTCVVEANGVLTVETPSGEETSNPTDAFARAVGWRGSESLQDDLPVDTSVTDANGRRAYTGASAFGIPGFVPLVGAEAVPIVETDTEIANGGDGSRHAFDRYTASGYLFRFAVRGAAQGRTVDRAANLRSMLRRAESVVTVYPSWGSEAQSTGEMETRRHRGMRRCVNSIPAHDLQYTADADLASLYYGPRAGGRLVLYTAGDDRSRDDDYNSRANSVQDVEVRLYVDLTEHPEAQDEM